MGDMIRVTVGAIYHYGVFVSEEEVIQFGEAPRGGIDRNEEEIEVCSTDIYSFLGGEFAEVAELDRKERKKRLSPEETVRIARERLGTRGYHILYNNCEHFAHECVMGEKFSEQVDGLRLMLREKFRAKSGERK